MPRRGPTRTDGSPSGWSHGCCGRRSRRCGERLDCNPPRDTVVRVTEWLRSAVARGVDGWLLEMFARVPVVRSAAGSPTAVRSLRRTGRARRWCVETGWRTVVLRAAREGVRCATFRCHRRGFASPRRGDAGKRSRPHRSARQPEAPRDTWAATRGLRRGVGWSGRGGRRTGLAESGRSSPRSATAGPSCGPMCVLRRRRARLGQERRRVRRQPENGRGAASLAVPTSSGGAPIHTAGHRWAPAESEQLVVGGVGTASVGSGHSRICGCGPSHGACPPLPPLLSAVWTGSSGAADIPRQGCARESSAKPPHRLRISSRPVGQPSQVA
jgi:hypothetical protein